MAYAANLGRGDITYPGLIAAWSAKGKTNDDEDRAILKDLTGNGHDITLNGFAFSEMSGYGGYNYDFTKNFFDTIKPTIKNSLTFEINGYPKDRRVLERNYGIGTTLPLVIKKLKIKATIKNNTTDAPIKLYITGTDQSIQITTSGVYEIKEYTVNSMTSLYGVYIGFVFNGENVVSLENPDYYCKIELLPEYPDALVFDGVDDYGICDNIPILDDYTFIIKRDILKDKTQFTAVCGTNSASKSSYNYFWFEYQNITGDTYKTYSWGNAIDIELQKDISYQTKTSYNGQSINMVASVERFGNIFSLGSCDNRSSYCANMVFYSAYLFDRSLDEQEIKEFIRKYIDPEYLLPSEIPTPDCYYDFSLGSNDDENRETIKDQSGNGNDAKAYNIAWSEMSGYGGYNWNFNAFSRNYWEHTDSKIILDYNNKPTQHLTVFEHGYTPSNSIKGVQIKVSGIKNGSKFNLYNQLNRVDLSVIEVNKILIKSDGIYSIPDIIISDGSNVATSYYGFNSITIEEGDVVTIEQIPLYPNALVLDGTDDYIALESFTSGFKTMFMLVNPLSEQRVLYDQRNEDLDDYAVFNNGSNVAHNARNKNGTYINGKLNTTILSRELVNKKHLIMVISESLSSKLPIIGSNNNHNGLFSSMAIYKFLGFKEKLTEDQIQYVIKNYNLLDGVDEIEVS